MASTRGRQVVVPLTNKSGGGVIAGDVVIIDTGNDAAFTTTTSAATTVTVGIAQETIASNAIGRVLLGGYAALVNVNASVTRGHFAGTHTVAKQAASLGASRVAGAFCQFLTGGTTPTAVVYPVDLVGASGAMATDALWDAAGDLAQGTGANTGAKLSAGLAGQALISAGAAAANAWKYPPGYEFDYVGITSAVNPTATTEGTANTVITGSTVIYDGSTIIRIEVFAPYAVPDLTVAGRSLSVYLYDSAGGGAAASIGRLGALISPSTNADHKPLYLVRRLTPTAATHAYSIRAAVSAGTGAIGAGAGGNGADMPAFIRITKVA